MRRLLILAAILLLIPAPAPGATLYVFTPTSPGIPGVVDLLIEGPATASAGWTSSSPADVTFVAESAFPGFSFAQTIAPPDAGSTFPIASTTGATLDAGRLTWGSLPGGVGLTLALSGTPGADTVTLSQSGPSTTFLGNFAAFTTTITTPEPPAYLLLGVGLGVVALARRSAAIRSANAASASRTE